MQRPLLILDLDETLIWASEVESAAGFDFRAGPYFVVKRPFLDEFLAQVSAWFRIAVWTSSSRDYASMILEELIGERIELCFAWSRDRCTPRLDPHSQELYYAKNLAKVKRRGYQLERVLILDDSPEKVRQSFGNHIRVRPFEGDASDRELLDLLPFLDSIRDKPNFRSIEKRDWRGAV